MDKDYACICGITQKELTGCFAPETKRMSDELDMSLDECLEELKRMYDGWRVEKL